MDEVRQTLVSAAIYPFVLVLVGGAVLLSLLNYVVPRFSDIFVGIHRDLLWAARLLTW